jgi:transcription factor SPT20
MGSSQARVAPRKLNEPCVWDTEYILRKHNGKLPSLVLHLHPTHFRFDQQDGSFGYNSPMKIILEHIQSQTVPHEMIEELYRANVTFYDGCLIVEIHNHKTGPASSRDQPQDVGRGKGFVPFSLHNQSDWVTPSPYAPAIKIEEKDGVTAMEKRQSSQGKDAGRKKTVFTTVLHPTQLSRNREIAYMVNTPAPDRSRRGSAVSAGRAATDSPVTPLTPAPASTTSRQPPSKRQKMMLDEKDVHEFEAQVLRSSEVPLFLDPAQDLEDAQSIMKALIHPLHNYAPVKILGRKRTTAEVAADEAQVADEERVALIMDERLKPSLSSNNAGAGDAVGNAEFVPNFSRFKALEDIKKHFEDEKARKNEQDRKNGLEARERAQLQMTMEKQQKENALRTAQQQEVQNKTSQLQLQRQAMAQAQANAHAQSQTAAGRMNPMQQQVAQNMQASLLHAQAQQQLMAQQNQQAQGGQQGSPTTGGRMPSQSSPPANMVNGQSAVPMMSSASNQGHANSPARPPSAMAQVQMARQMSGQAQMTGTPQMQQMTPMLANGQAARHITPQPRLNQASPPAGSIQGTPMMNMAGTPQMSGQQMNQQQALLMQQKRAAQLAQQQHAMQGSPHQITHQMSPQQQAAMMQAQQASSPHVQNMNGQAGNMQNPGINQQMRAPVTHDQYRKQLMTQQSNAQANIVQNPQQLQQQRAAQQAQAQQQANFNPNATFNPSMLTQNMVRGPSQAQAQAQASMMQQQNSQMMAPQMQQQISQQQNANGMVTISQAQRETQVRQVYLAERNAYYQRLAQQNGGQIPQDAQARFDQWKRNRQIYMQRQQMQARALAAQGGAGVNATGNGLMTPGGSMQPFQQNVALAQLQAAQQQQQQNQQGSMNPTMMGAPGNGMVNIAPMALAMQAVQSGQPIDPSIRSQLNQSQVQQLQLKHNQMIAQRQHMRQAAMMRQAQQQGQNGQAGLMPGQGQMPNGMNGMFNGVNGSGGQNGQG